MKIECYGELMPNGQIQIESSVISKIQVGTKLKMKIEILAMEEKGNKLSPAAERLLARMKNAKPLGAPRDPRKLRHSVLAEERLEEKSPPTEAREISKGRRDG